MIVVSTALCLFFFCFFDYVSFASPSPGAVSGCARKSLAAGPKAQRSPQLSVDNVFTQFVWTSTAISIVSTDMQTRYYLMVTTAPKGRVQQPPFDGTAGPFPSFCVVLVPSLLSSSHLVVGAGFTPPAFGWCCLLLGGAAFLPPPLRRCCLPPSSFELVLLSPSLIWLVVLSSCH